MAVFPPGQGPTSPFPVPPSAGSPQSGKRAWSDIGSKTKGLFGGVKNKWGENTPAEKRCLITAASAAAIAALVFALLALIFSFGSAFSLLPAILTVAIPAVTIPMGMYAGKKVRRGPSKPDPKQLEMQRKEEERIAAATKAHRVYNRSRRKLRARL